MCYIVGTYLLVNKGEFMKKKGKIIAISGMDASGKSTVSRFLQEELKRRNIQYIVTKQPCLCIKRWGEFKDLLKNQSEELDFKMIGGLISWGRVNTQVKEVEPALENGIWIICERYILDIMAWSIFRKAPDKYIKSWILPIYNEDILFLCDSDCETICRRLNARGEGEKIGEDSKQNVNQLVQLYRKLAKERAAIFVDTNRDFKDAKEIIYTTLDKMRCENE